MCSALHPPQAAADSGDKAKPRGSHWTCANGETIESGDVKMPVLLVSSDDLLDDIVFSRQDANRNPGILTRTPCTG